MKNTVNKFSNIEFWKKLNPQLSITSKPFAQQPPPIDISDDAAERCLNRVIDEGYFSTEALIPHAEVTAIADAIERIVSLGLPPVFIYVYDEVWQIFNRLSNVIDPVLDANYKITIAGMWAWHIGNEGEGFPVHRDMFAYNLLEDGRPKHLTLWIPFTDVTPLNSCMHVLPTHLDPNFPDKLREKIVIPNFSHIRALPVKAGSILAWNANIAHWGSKSSKWIERPRISIGMDFSRADADMDGDNLSYAGGPELAQGFNYQQRLSAIGQAIRFYKKRIPELYPETAEVLFEFSDKYSLTSDSISSFSKGKTTEKGLTNDNATDNKTVEKASSSDVKQINIDANAETTDTATSKISANDTTTDNAPSNTHINTQIETTNKRLTPASKCIIRNCGKQGFAVYATEKIMANEIIEECHLVPVYQELIQGCVTNHLIESFDFRVSATQTEQVIVLGFAGSYRHSSAANTAWRQRKSKRTFVFYAERDIEIGEEIRIDYLKGKSTVMELVPPSKLEVKKNHGKGLGVFATEDIKKGEILEDCPIKALGDELSATNVFADYRFNYPKGIDSKQRVLTLGLGAVFNHSDDNNAYWINHPDIENVLRFVADKDIACGEEICTS
ncbi:MAG: SET domain-containing protein-lysine N-methyltransferase [Thiotrichaceae bacterium]